MWRVATIPAVLLAASPAYAQSGRGDVKIDTVVFVVNANGSTMATRLPQLQYGMERALRKQPRIKVHSVDARLAQTAGETPKARVSEALGLLRSGEALLAKATPRAALNRLRPALSHLQALLAYVEKRKFARAQFLLGVAHVMLGNTRAAHKLFVRLMIWRPGFRVVTKYAPSKVLPIWQAARTRVAKRGGGSIELRSTPTGALSYVDGAFVGTTPTQAEALTLGTHYVTFKRPGYRRVVAKVVVSAKRQRRITGRLRRTPGDHRMRRLLKQVSAGLGRVVAPKAMRKLGEMVSAQHLVFLRRLSGSGNRFQAYVYDARTRRRLSAVRTSLPRNLAKPALAKLVRTLYAGINWTRAIVRRSRPTPSKRTSRSDRSLFGRWWFWTGILAVVAVPAVLSALPGGGPSCPSGFMCGRLRLRF